MSYKNENEGQKKTQHKSPFMELEKKGNIFTNLDNPDDPIQKQTGDNKSLIVEDSPDD